MVLDSSALIALVRSERGEEIVEAAIQTGGLLLCAVNLAEFVAKRIEQGADLEQVLGEVDGVSIQIIDFDRDLAVRAGLLRAVTRHHGLSLGDRACLALAEREGLPVLTADQAWVDLGVGIDIRMIR